MIFFSSTLSNQLHFLHSDENVRKWEIVIKMGEFITISSETIQPLLPESEKFSCILMRISHILSISSKCKIFSWSSYTSIILVSSLNETSFKKLLAADSSSLLIVQTQFQSRNPLYKKLSEGKKSVAYWTFSLHLRANIRQRFRFYTCIL